MINLITFAKASQFGNILHIFAWSYAAVEFVSCNKRVGHFNQRRGRVLQYLGWACSTVVLLHDAAGTAATATIIPIILLIVIILSILLILTILIMLTILTILILIIPIAKN